MPIKTHAPRVYRTTYLTPKDDRKLAAKAKRKGISIAALIREYIEEGLSRGQN